MNTYITRYWAVAAIIMLAACTAQMGDWGAIATASSGPPQAIGSYANGCLAGAQSLRPDGPGYQVMRLRRGRFYGHPQLIYYIETLGRHMAAAHRTVLIGDMAQPRGGPMLSGHASHQTGLEVDIWYRTLPEQRSLTLQAREELAAESLVLADGSAVDPAHWRQADADLLRLAALPDSVARIFVHPAIKRELCRTKKGQAWLHKLRPWWGHDDHFHVRLNCPAGDAQCVAQPDNIPPGDGCDATLDWWFTPEALAARTTSHNVTMTETPMDAIPAACRALLAPDRP